MMALAAILVLTGQADAQVYPEQACSVTRTVVKPKDSVRTEAYQRNQQREEQTDRTTRTLRIGANGELYLENIAGDIVITRGGDNDATVEIVKVARGRTADEARESLQLVQVDVAERGSRAEINVRYPRRDERSRDRRNFNVSVAFNVTAPERARITVKTISGNISVRDIKGDLGLETISGNIRIANAGRIPLAKTISGNVEIADTSIEGTMDASTVSGTLLLRKLTARRLDFYSISGNVELQDVNCDRIYTTVGQRQHQPDRRTRARRPIRSRIALRRGEGPGVGQRRIRALGHILQRLHQSRHASHHPGLDARRPRPTTGHARHLRRWRGRPRSHVVLRQHRDREAVIVDTTVCFSNVYPILAAPPTREPPCERPSEPSC